MNYAKPVIFGLIVQENADAMGGRYMGGTVCCMCSGHGSSRG